MAQLKNRFSHFSGIAASDAALHIRENNDTVNKVVCPFFVQHRTQYDSLFPGSLFPPGRAQLQPRCF